MTDFALEIKEAFQRAQKGHNNRAKLVAALKSRYNKLDDKTSFHEVFVHYLKYAMIVYKREPAVENVIEFVGKFATSFEVSVDDAADIEEEENPFLNCLFNFLLESHNANSHAVRFRVCQLINKLLGSMAENAQIDDDLFDKIHDTMLIRVTDKFPNVRIQAALAMARLQDPQNSDCPTIKAYLLILENDSNPEVRRAVLSCIAPCAQTLPKILRRTRDVKDSVRKLAYQVLADKVHLRALSIEQRVNLLQQGLNDVSEAVKEVVQKKLLPAWLRLLQGDVLELLHRLDVENCSEVAVTALNAIFTLSMPEDLLQNRISLDGRKLLPVENLTCENVLYWRALCEFVKAKGDEGEEMLEQLLPEAAIFAEYLYGYLKIIPVLSEEKRADFTEVEVVMTMEFIGQQLVLLVGCLDTAEEGGRKRVLSVLQEMLVLPNTPISLVSLLVEKLLALLSDHDKRIQVVAEVISEIREPIVLVKDAADENELRKRQVRLAEVKVKIFEAKQALEECIAAQDFSRASDLKDSITELENLKNELMKEAEEPGMKESRVEKNDPETLLKCLTMFAELLKQMSMKKGIGPTINGILESLVLPGIACSYPAVRNMAVVCLGICALHSRDLANRHLVLLLQIAQLDEPKIRISALRAVVDQLLLNGLDVVKQKPCCPMVDDCDGQTDTKSGEESKEAEDEQDAIQSILLMFSQFLDSEISGLRTETAEGLAKLMYCGRLRSTKLLSRLVLLWYNPVTEDDTRLRHCLGVFFQLYCRESRANQECIEESFIPTLQTLLNAPATSPLAEVDVSNVAELFVELTRPSVLIKANKSCSFEDTSVHDCLAARLCSEMLKDPSAPEVRLYARCLSALELTMEDCTSKSDLLLLLHEVCQVVKDRISFRAIEKVMGQLKGGSKSKSSVTQDEESTVHHPDENGQEAKNCEEELKSTKKPKKGQRKTTASKKVSTSKESPDSEGEKVEERIPATRSSRRAKMAAMEKTKLDLSVLMKKAAK